MFPGTTLGRPRQRVGGYREYPAPPPLERYVEGVWTHHSPDRLPAGPGAMHRVLPDPALSLAFYCRRGDAGVPLDAGLVVIGPKTRPHIFAFRPALEVAAIRVKLEWSGPLLGLDPAGHEDAEHRLATVDPRLESELLEPLAETLDASEAAARLGALISGRAAALEARGPTAAGFALDLVRRSGGAVGVERAAGHAGVPARTLHRAVRRAAGISLKRFARVTRLLRAVALADRSRGPSWAAIAAESGFCDQSHLVRECRALSGLAPGEVHRERRAQEAETSNRG